MLIGTQVPRDRSVKREQESLQEQCDRRRLSTLVQIAVHAGRNPPSGAAEELPVAQYCDAPASVVIADDAAMDPHRPSCRGRVGMWANSSGSLQGTTGGLLVDLGE